MTDDAVLRSTQGRIGILTVNNPPVNALAAAVRSGIKEGVEAFGKDSNIDAIVLIGGGRTFIAGADIREFGKPPSGPNLNDVIATMENCPKIVVAALHGTPLGGGLETALGAHYRVSLASTRMGLPEVHLGILPGAGGTQRLPRLTGAKYALDAIISGRHIPAPEAKSKGIIDAIVDGDLLAGAVAHAQMLVAQNAPRRKVRDLKATLESPDLFQETEKAIARRARGFKAPWNIIKCVQAACELPFDEGMKRERELVLALLVTVVDILIALPIAFFMAKVAGPRLQRILVVAVLMPLWASYLVKAHAWRSVLSEGGIWSSIVEPFGGESPGYGLPAVVMTLAYLWLPYVILPIYAGLERVPNSLLEASGDLGAKTWRTVVSVVLPMLTPAIIAASIFSFSLSLGDYITVNIVGGTSQMLGNLVYTNVGAANNLPLAAAIALVPVAIMVVYLTAARRSGALENL